MEEERGGELGGGEVDLEEERGGELGGELGGGGERWGVRGDERF